MNRTTYIVLVTAGLVVFPGVAMAAPVHAQQSAAPNQADAGPPADLPEPVPDFVGSIHELIQQFLDGELTGSLGELVRGATPAKSTS